MKWIAAMGALAAFCLAGPGAAQQDLSNPDSDFVDTARKSTWHAEIERTERGHLIGNPEAKTQLIEFISYSCGHCAKFAREGEPALELGALAPGLLSMEVRPVIRNALDLTVSLLVQCGDVAGFKDRHRMFLYAQDKWLAAAQNAPQSQQMIWQRGDAAARLNLARALDLDDMLAQRGLSAPQVNACLMDDDAATALIANGRADASEFGIPGTPSFALDGELLADVYSWNALYPVLSDHFKPGSSRK